MYQQGITKQVIQCRNNIDKHIINARFDLASPVMGYLMQIRGKLQSQPETNRRTFNPIVCVLIFENLEQACGQKEYQRGEGATEL